MCACKWVLPTRMRACLCVCVCMPTRAYGYARVCAHFRSKCACMRARGYMPVRVCSPTWACVHASAPARACSLSVCACAYVCVRLPMCACAHLRVLVHLHVCFLRVRACACLSVCVRIFECVYMRAPTRACVPAGMCVCLCASACLRVCAWVRAWVCIPAWAHLRVQMRKRTAGVYVCLCMCARIYANKHACVSPPTQVSMHVCARLGERACESCLWACACSPVRVCACTPTRASVHVCLHACVLPAQTYKSAHMCALLHVLARLHICVFACGPACAFVCGCRFVCFCVYARLFFCSILGKQRYNTVWTCKILGIIPWEWVNMRHHSYTNGFTQLWQFRNYDVFY